MHVAEPEVAEARGGMFGFSVNNTIGESPQPNGWMDDWVEFFRVRRIGHQLKLARWGGSHKRLFV
jgi:fructosamine-3-kinase